MADAETRSTSSCTEYRRHAFLNLNVPIQPTISFGTSFHDICTDYVTRRDPPAKPFVLVDIRLHPSRCTKQAQEFLPALNQPLGACSVGTLYISDAYRSWADSVPIIKAIRASSADTLIVIGNDAIIDLAKVVVYGHSQLVEDSVEHLNKLLTPRQTDNGIQLFRQEAPSRKPLVFICVPTDSGGTAYSLRALGINPVTSANAMLVRPTNYPRLVILDPTVSIATPSSTWIAKGIEAINHAVEGLVSVNTTPQMDEILEISLRNLCTGLLMGNSNYGSMRQKLNARFIVLIGANLAMAPQASSPEIVFGISHAVCNAAHSTFRIKRGCTAAVVLPAVLEWTLSKFDVQSEAFHKVLALHQKIAKILWESPICDFLFRNAGLNQKTHLGRLLRVMFTDLGMPNNLQDLGVSGEQNLNCLAERVIKQNKSKMVPVKTMDFSKAKEFLSLVASPLPSNGEPTQEVEKPAMVPHLRTASQGVEKPAIFALPQTAPQGLEVSTMFPQRKPASQGMEIPAILFPKANRFQRGGDICHIFPKASRENRHPANKS